MDEASLVGRYPTQPRGAAEVQGGEDDGPVTGPRSGKVRSDQAGPGQAWALAVAAVNWRAPWGGQLDSSSQASTVQSTVGGYGLFLSVHQQTSDQAKQ